MVHLPDAPLTDAAVMRPRRTVHLAARTNRPVLFGRGVRVAGVQRAPTAAASGPIAVLATGFLARVGI